MKTLDLVVEMFQRRLARWKMNYLSKSGRSTLIQSIVSNMPIYFLSILTILAKVAKKLENIKF